VAVFVVSALQDLRALATATLLAALVFHRDAARRVGRMARSVLPATMAFSVLSVAWLRLVDGRWPALEPFAALLLRVLTISFVSFAVLERVHLLKTLAPFPTLSRLLVVTLAQIHALRLLLTESRDGLRSRMPRRPGALDVVRNAGGITAALFTLTTRNAREIGDAMRSRGF
jgi:cobalt/nickel transport system permease protein